MAKKKDVQLASSETGLADIKYTNRLFLDLLYNLSKYPHAKKSKRLVAKGFLTLRKTMYSEHQKQKNKLC